MPNVAAVEALSADRARSLLDGMRGIHALVVGDAMLDVYLRGSATRISPEAPVPVVRVVEEWRALGGAANVAANVVALGASCDLVACAGSDEAGRQLIAGLGELGIAADAVHLAAGRRTTVKTRVLVGHQQVARFDAEVDDDVDEAIVAAMIDSVGRLTAIADVIVLEDYDKGALVPALIERVIAAARSRGIATVVDPKARRFFAYRGATVFKPNRVELSNALREVVREDDAAWLQRARQALGCEHLLVTLGEQGMALATAGGAHVRVSTAAQPVFDVSGAGDTVSAVVALALAAGASIEEAALLANHAAGIEIGKAGVATVSPAELLDTVRAQAGRVGRT